MARALCILWLAVALSPVSASVYNLRVVTDASPDYSDLDSLIGSATARWDRPEQKLWALFYWNHIARRQCSPMLLHGVALTDPIRQFNDYGFTMCSTIAGINCSIWDAMGFRVRYWDISNHTVPEVEYGGRWHMYDSSLSALYTLCDGTTIAGVEDIGATRGCAASGGREEPGHIAKYHCLTATSANGFLTGSDTTRSLDDEYRCFNPNGLKLRTYFYDWDRGHRYIVNLRDGESYTRYYQKQGDTSAHFVPLGGKDPDDGRFGLRGNGLRTYHPSLTAASLERETISLRGVRPVDGGGIQPAAAGEPGQAVFKIEGSNVITSLTIAAAFRRATEADTNSIAISTTNGLTWTDVWTNAQTGDTPLSLELGEPVNGAYEVLVRVTLSGAKAAADAQLRSIEFRAVTELNAKTQPQLLLGRNTVYVDAGPQEGSVVLWPDLQGDHYKPYVAEERNIGTEAEHPGYQGVMHARRPGEDAYVVFRLDTPGDTTRIHYGGRLYNRAPGSRIAFSHSFDGGATWTETYALTDTEQPWDVIRYVTADAPPGTRSALVKYLLQSREAGKDACSLYSVRLEASYTPPDAASTPLEVTFGWAERQPDYSLVERTHTQLVTDLPARYTLNVGGADHPVVRFLRIQPQGAEPATYGYSDGVDAGGERFVPRWATYGRNLAVGRSYTVSVPSNDNWGAGDPDGKRLTDGIVGPFYAGGVTPMYCLGWDDGQVVDITVDLGEPQRCGGFRIHLGGGWPWWDALKGEVKDTVEVLTSTDGEQYSSAGSFDLNPRRKDLPINLMLPDEETLGAYLFDLALPEPIEARFVRFHLTAKRSVCVSEVQVLDQIRSEPFDLRIALPDERPPGSGEAPKVLTPNGRPVPAPQAQANSAEPLGEPVLEPATLRSLGVHWLIGRDANQNAQVTLAYRRQGEERWQDGMPLFRIEKGAHRNDEGQASVEVPDDAWLFAGSALLLEPDAAYELRLRLADPDGGEAEKVLQARTIGEPTEPEGMRVRHVTPGDGGGAGTEQDPFRGLAAAEAAAEPGDLLLLAAGQYAGTFEVTRSGEPGRPIIWRGDGEAILDAQGQAAERPGRGISASGVHDVWFERLGIRNADYGIVAHRSSRIVVRRCHISGVEYGMTCTNNDDGSVTDFFIADNTIEGPCVWPRSKGIEDARGIQVTGTGHVVCYNRITGFADAIDTFPSPQCFAIDIHNNDISVMTDDGIEMDYSERNTRCFENRLTNAFQGVSFQPVFGGPVYAFRNVLYNVAVEPFKLHNSPSGALMLHNTCVKQGMPLTLMTGETVRNCVSRSNLFIGTTAGYAYETTAPMQDCDFDYDGFGGGPWELFLKWNGGRYADLDEVRAKASVYAHAVLVDPATAFASGALPPASVDTRVDAPPDLRLSEGSAAVDAGALIGYCGPVLGAAPDLGAYELGQPLPHYGPR